MPKSRRKGNYDLKKRSKKKKNNKLREKKRCDRKIAPIIIILRSRLQLSLRIWCVFDMNIIVAVTNILILYSVT